MAGEQTNTKIIALEALVEVNLEIHSPCQETQFKVYVDDANF